FVIRKLRFAKRGGLIMSFTLESFAAECRRLIKADPSAAGRGKVVDLVREALKDEKFIGAYVNDNTPDRQVIYEDPELGFCICAHLSRGAKEANPHDHGTSWAIYGQTIGETEMRTPFQPEPASEPVVSETAT
ncbi:MAG TPA: hypothetical protein VIH00_00705, partial [Candidatus Limnocylindrales bacterium]